MWDKKCQISEIKKRFKDLSLNPENKVRNQKF